MGTCFFKRTINQRIFLRFILRLLAISIRRLPIPLWNDIAINSNYVLFENSRSMKKDLGNNLNRKSSLSLFVEEIKWKLGSEWKPPWPGFPSFRLRILCWTIYSHGLLIWKGGVRIYVNSAQEVVAVVTLSLSLSLIPSCWLLIDPSCTLSSSFHLPSGSPAL